MSELDRFIKENIAITFDNKYEQKDFLKRCEKEGLMWKYRGKATRFKPLLSCYIFYNFHSNNVLTWDRNPDGWTPISYKEYFKKDEITITRFDNKVGVARCNPKDEFKPYLLDIEMYNQKWGYIGEETNLTLPFGEKLYVGDVVELFNIKKNKIFKEKQFVCKGDNEYFVMLFKCRKFKNGIDDFGEWQIRKVKSYKDLENDETIFGVKAVLKEN